MCNFSSRLVYYFFLIFFNFKNSALSDPVNEDFKRLLGNSSITISLRDYGVSNPGGDSIDSLYLLPPYSSSEIIVTQIPSDAHFVVVQVHSYLLKVTLSLDFVPSQKNSITGTNVGLLKINQKKTDDLSFYLTFNSSVEEAHIMVSVQAYSKNAPVPGGCNLEFPVEISPFLLTTYDDIVTEVKFAPSAPPSAIFSEYLLFPSNECNVKPSPVHHKVYYQYTKERDFSKETYFNVLKSMMTEGRILQNGALVPDKLTASPAKKTFSTYPGTGRAVAVMSYFANYSAVYVPSLTYGCSELKEDNTCDVLTTTFSKVLCALVLFLGLFSCFFGHFFFRLEIFLFGFLATGIITYILVAIFFSQSVALSSAVSLGIFSAAGMLIVLTIIGLPIMAITLATLTFGFLIASLIFYPTTDHVSFFVLDINYWGIFIGILATCPLIMLCLAEKANIVSSAVLGAYMAVTSIDHYLGSNLRYIVINTIRRAIDERFRFAITVPPFQLNDIILTVTWLILSLLGNMTQRKLTKNKPPFPPPVNPFSGWRKSPPPRPNPPSERTPLMSNHVPPGFTPSNYYSGYYDGN